MPEMHPASSESLPMHLAEHPKPKGLARIGAGTAVFNVVAIGLLATISMFVVFGAAAPDDDEDFVTAPPRPPEIDAEIGAAHRGQSSTATTSTPSTSTPTTTEAPPETRPPRAEVRAVSHEPAQPPPAPTPPPPPSTEPPVTCDRFATQPESQVVFDQDPEQHAGMDGNGNGIACEHLHGAPQPEPPPPSFVIPTKSQLLRPSTRLYGVHTREAPFAMHELEAFTESAGKSPNNVLFFTTFSRGFPGHAVDNAWDAGMLPIITFEPVIENSDRGQPLMRDIANGEWDEYFIEWATEAKENGKPMGFRFAQEMNGNWYSWSDGRMGNATGDFSAAWRHLHDLFTEVGADNLLWIWSVNRIDTLPDRGLARVYPGDEYVDWVGISGYYRSEENEPTFESTFSATLDELRRVAPDKLVLLTEVGAGTSEANRVAWIDSLFEGLLARQEIVGFTWFNDFKSGGDWQIQFSQATTDAFAAGVADPRYGAIARRSG